MNSDKSSGFRFRIDAENPDSILRDDFDDRKQKKPTGRMPRTAIIIPVLLALTLGWVYYDLKKSVTTLRILDVHQLQSFKKEINSRYNTISLNISKTY
jgi:hypothetical protein